MKKYTVIAKLAGREVRGEFNTLRTAMSFATVSRGMGAEVTVTRNW